MVTARAARWHHSALRARLASGASRRLPMRWRHGQVFLLLPSTGFVRVLGKALSSQGFFLTAFAVHVTMPLP